MKSQSLKVFTFYKQMRHMPQMAPMNWFFIFILLSSSYWINLFKIHFYV